MSKLFNIFIVSVLISLLISCEKEININLSEKDKLIVIEGTIETNEQPYVYITNSIGFFDQINLDNIAYIKNAIISVQDIITGQTIQLKEYNIDTTVGGQTFSFTLYAPDINDPIALNFKGQIDHSYKLSVLSNGKSYEAFTKIPSSNGIDSLWTEPVPGREDSFSTLNGLYVDPDTFGNSVRVQTMVSSPFNPNAPKIFLSAFTSVYNDDIVNGTKLPIKIDIGYDKTKDYSQEEFKTLGFLHKGDTVTVKWSAIDKKVYKFWETLSYSQGSIGNPFASPTKIQSNIPGALGVWAGYNSTYYTIVDTLK